MANPETTPPRTAKLLSEAFKEVEGIVLNAAKVIGEAERERDNALSSYEGQRRNTIAFKREVDTFRALLRRWLNADMNGDLHDLVEETEKALADAER